MRNLPSIVSKLPNDLKQFLERVREAFNKGEIVTKEELIQAGIARPGRGGAIESVDGSPILPPAPINVTATGAMTSIFVEFDYPEYRGHAYAEIWRAETNDIGQAQMVGQTPGKFYSDAVGGASVRWYWVRLVSTTDTKGPYNGTEGTRGETSPDSAYLLDQLAGSITESQLHAGLNSRIDLVDGPDSLLGSVNHRLLQEAQARAAAIASEASSRAQAISSEASTRAAADLAESTARAQAIADETSARVASIQAETDARNAAIAQEAYQRSKLADENAEAVLQSALTIHEELANRAEDIALARFELNENLQTGLSAEASARLVLAAAVADNAASILNEQTVRANADSAIANDLSNLAVTVGNNTSAIQAEATARADGDSAEANQRNLLAAQMRGGYSGNDLSQVTTGLLYQERIARVSQDQALAQQITLLSAGAGEQFDWKTIWYFDEGAEGWTGNGTPTVANGWLRPANQATDAHVISPVGIAADGNQYGQVRLRIRKVGSPTFAGYLWWKAAGDSTWDASRRFTLTDPTYDANGIGLITVSPAWAVTINQVRVDLSSAQTAGDYFEIDWVAIGRPSPGASSAQLLGEQTARAAADAAEIAAREALSVKLTGTTDPSSLTLGTLASGLLYDERQARVTQDTAIASSVTSLQATVTSNFNTLNSAITAEQTARANADSAEVSARQALSTKMTGMADPAAATLGTLTSGLIFDERQARSTADSAIASDLSVLSSTVTTNHSTAMGAITTESNARAVADAANAEQITTLVATTRELGRDKDSNAWAILENVLAGDRSTQQTRETLAVIKNEVTVKVEEGLLAEATARNLLAATVNANTAAIASEATARAAADSAMASQIDTLVAGVAGNVAAITTEATTRANADTALSQQITTLSSTVAGNTSAIQNEATTRANADTAMATQISSVISISNANTAAITAEASTRASEDAALSTRIDTVVADVDDAVALIQSETIALAAADTAMATQISTLQSTVGGNTASIQTQATTINGLSAQHTVKIDNNGYVTGYGLASTPVDGVPVSEFAVVADKFTIAPVATNPSAADGSPFFYLTAPTTINGVSIPAGAYMKSAYIHDASITNAKIANLSAEKITAGDIAADRMSANAIQAVNLSAQYIHADRIDAGTLTAKLAAIETAYIDEANITNGAISNAKIGEFIQSNNYAADSAGWRIDKSGFAEFQNVKVRGDVQATSLNAATGTFAGTLQAATGTFGGQLMAGVLDLALAAGSSHIYDQPGTYYFTVPAGMTSIRITCVGGGGGGGGGGATVTSIKNTWNMGGGGGGGGGSGHVTQAIYTSITPGTVLTINVGTGGIGGVGQANIHDNSTGDYRGRPGASGGASSVSGYLSASGGTGGVGGRGPFYTGTPGTGSYGGIGGSLGGATGGAGSQVVYQGSEFDIIEGFVPVDAAYPVGGAGGLGGASGYGTPGAGRVNSAATSGIRGSGGGGGNGCGDYNRPFPTPDNGLNGGNGGNGVVIIEAYNPNAVVLQTTFKTFTNNHFNALCTHVGRGDLIFAG